MRQFRQDLALHEVDVVSVESQFQAPVRQNMNAPDPNNRAATVQYIMDKSMGGTTRERVNAKNLWSLWSVYRHGGYHLDTGVVRNQRMAIRVPPPQVFCLPDVTFRFDDTTPAEPAPKPSFFNKRVKKSSLKITTVRGGAGTVNYAHANVNNLIGAGPVCSTMTGLDGKLGTHVLNGHVGPLRPTTFNANIDVWMLGSPAGDPVVERALDWYMAVWFYLERAKGGALNGDAAGYKEACRGAIISAVATAIAHAGLRQCNTAQQAGRHLIRTRDAEVADFNLKKHGFQSHR